MRRGSKIVIDTCIYKYVLKFKTQLTFIQCGEVSEYCVASWNHSLSPSQGNTCIDVVLYVSDVQLHSCLRPTTVDKLLLNNWHIDKHLDTKTWSYSLGFLTSFKPVHNELLQAELKHWTRIVGYPCRVFRFFPVGN